MAPIGQGDDVLCYQIRLMRPEDIAQVTQIDREAFPTMSPPANYHSELKNRLARYIVIYDDNAPISTPPPTSPPQNILSLIRDSLRRWWGQSPGTGGQTSPPDNSCILGFAGTWIIATEAHIINIAVRHSYRRHGIGELLLISLIELAQEYHISLMILEVRASNIAAQQLYYKYQFQQIGRRKGYYSNNLEDALLMSIEDINATLFQTRFSRLKRAYTNQWRVSLPRLPRHLLTGWR